ncbi:MAG: hypothetical protein ACOYEH_10170 [Caldicoprobacterales bacterium]
MYIALATLFYQSYLELSFSISTEFGAESKNIELTAVTTEQALEALGVEEDDFNGPGSATYSFTGGDAIATVSPGDPPLPDNPILKYSEIGTEPAAGGEGAGG